jgi:hypothetical protein
LLCAGLLQVTLPQAETTKVAATAQLQVSIFHISIRNYGDRRSNGLHQVVDIKEIA